MKKAILYIALAAMAGASNTARARSPELPKTNEHQVSINTVYIPSGFGNDEPYAVLGGMFPNSCYSWNRADVTHLSDTMHEVRAVANVRMGMCLMVLVPYTEEAPLGRLSKGDHTLRFMNGDGTYQEKKLVVE